MGMFDFVKSAGRKLGILAEEAPSPAAKAAQAQALALIQQTQTALGVDDKNRLQNQAVAADITAQIISHQLSITELNVLAVGSTVTLRGKAKTKADAEKAVLVAGNTEGIEKVDDQLAVLEPSKPAVHHTVVRGDTLSELSLKYYGVIHMYDAIFEANKPMLSHPDKIYPGQVLRIPPIEAPKHTVAAGETLGTIAKRWYGDAKKYTVIFEANKGILPNADTVKVGQVLTIPLVNPKV